MEKKMWSIFGALAVISFIVSPVGQRIVGTLINSPEVERIK
jgi:fumarate reductase subunit D